MKKLSLLLVIIGLFSLVQITPIKAQTVISVSDNAIKILAPSVPGDNSVSITTSVNIFIEVSNAIGKIVKSSKIEQGKTVYIFNIPSGLYFISIQGYGGGKDLFGRFVVQ